MPSSTATDIATIAKGFHALSDPTRVEVVELLRAGERCVCELMDELDAAQSRLSFHLRVLRDAGLVKDRRDGRWVYYTLDPEVLGELESYLADFRTTRSSHNQTVNAACDSSSARCK